MCSECVEPYDDQREKQDCEINAFKRMARFLNRKSQRYYRLKFADTYYGEMTHYGLYRLAWADVRSRYSKTSESFYVK